MNTIRFGALEHFPGFWNQKLINDVGLSRENLGRHNDSDVFSASLSKADNEQEKEGYTIIATGKARRLLQAVKNHPVGQQALPELFDTIINYLAPKDSAEAIDMAADHEDGWIETYRPALEKELQRLGIDLDFDALIESSGSDPNDWADEPDFW